jgi:hypothetical protein
MSLVSFINSESSWLFVYLSHWVMAFWFDYVKPRLEGGDSWSPGNKWENPLRRLPLVLWWDRVMGGNEMTEILEMYYSISSHWIIIRLSRNLNNTVGRDIERERYILYPFQRPCLPHFTTTTAPIIMSWLDWKPFKSVPALSSHLRHHQPKLPFLHKRTPENKWENRWNLTDPKCLSLCIIMHHCFLFNSLLSLLSGTSTAVRPGFFLPFKWKWVNSAWVTQVHHAPTYASQGGGIVVRGSWI